MPRARRASPRITLTVAATESGAVGYWVAVTTISASLVVSAGSWAASTAGTRPRQATAASEARIMGCSCRRTEEADGGAPRMGPKRRRPSSGDEDGRTRAGVGPESPPFPPPRAFQVARDGRSPGFGLRSLAFPVIQWHYERGICP